MENDNSLYLCLYCGSSQEFSEKALSMFGKPSCCDHDMTCADRNLVLSMVLKGLPKLIEDLGKEVSDI